MLIYRGLGHRELRGGRARHARVDIAFLELPATSRVGRSACAIAGRDRGRDPRGARVPVLVLRLLATGRAHHPRLDLDARAARRRPVGRSSAATARPTTRSGRSSRTTRSTGAACACRSRSCTSSASPVVVTFLLWAFVRYTRVGARDHRVRAERARGADDGLVAQQAGRCSPGAWARGWPASPASCSPRSRACRRSRFTLIVTVTAMAAALLGGFRSFPLTLLGGLVIGIGEAAVTRVPLRHPELLRYRRADRARARHPVPADPARAGGARPWPARSAATSASGSRSSAPAAST